MLWLSCCLSGWLLSVLLIEDQSSDPLKSILLGPDQSTANHRNASELAPVLHHIQQRLPLASRHQMQGRVASEGE